MNKHRQNEAGQIMSICDYLAIGADNARTGKEICKAANLSQRDLTLLIERERRAGKPIYASTAAKNPGYYLAADKGEMQRFCNSLFHRAGEIHKTRKACLATMDTLPESEAANYGGY